MHLNNAQYACKMVFSKEILIAVIKLLHVGGDKENMINHRSLSMLSIE